MQWKKPVLVGGDTPTSDGYMLFHSVDVAKGGIHLWVNRKDKYMTQIQGMMAKNAAAQAKEGLDGDGRQELGASSNPKKSNNPGLKIPVGAAAGCDLLIFKIKRSQPAAAPTFDSGHLLTVATYAFLRKGLRLRQNPPACAPYPGLYRLPVTEHQ